MLNALAGSTRAAAEPQEPRSLSFCDVSMFYCERGGGIRTYHRAKMDWFARQSLHRYVLVAPGPGFRVTRRCETVTLIEVCGVPTGHGPDGYRVPVDLARLSRVVADLQPDIVEASDPWISGPVALLARRRGRVRGLIRSRSLPLECRWRTINTPAANLQRSRNTAHIGWCSSLRGTQPAGGS
jgi:hypothetical protein